MSSATTLRTKPDRSQEIGRPSTAGRLVRVVPLTPDRCAEWDRYVDSHAHGTIFHTIGWREAVGSAFGHEDIYLAALRDDRIVGVLPMFQVASALAGRMLVSVPYGVGGGIIAEGDEAVATLFDAAKRAAAKRNCRSIDLRSEIATVPGLSVADKHVGFRRELPDHPDDVLGWLPRKARAAARNARNKYRLTIAFGDEHLQTVWQLYTLSMRRLASPPYPLSFFESLIANTPERHAVSLALWNGRPVAGLVTFFYRDRVLPYFIGTTDEAKQCSAANFVYLCAMEHGVRAGYREFDFGRTRRDNLGSYNFKRFHGFAPQPLAYQSYTLPGYDAPDLSPTNPKFALARRIWPYLPLCVTRSVGAVVAKHITG